MSGEPTEQRNTPLLDVPSSDKACTSHPMNIPGEFVSLAKLIHSLDNNRRLYFLYRQAAETGSSGARLRFQWLVRSLESSEVRNFERIFKTSSPMQPTA